MIFDCPTCSALVDAVLVSHYEDGEGLEPSVLVRLFRCPKCAGPFLTQDLEFGEGRVLYPTIAAVNPELPVPIQIALGEAQTCFRAQAYTASTLMCRKTLEGLCAIHGAAGRGLVEQLKFLRDGGVIEQSLFEWADQLRISGNEAAHDVNVTIPLEDARDVLEFTKAILEYVFTFRDRFGAFKKRRAERQGAKATTTTAQS